MVNFFGAIFGPESWRVISAILAALVLVATVFGSFAAASRVAHTVGWGWNFIVVPAILSAGMFVILFLAWTTFGVDA